ncbi:MAG: Gfo/Idh/MocA family oxidoreductase [Actinomycetota bacterium]|nr:Gfo/Idh/MocA family oxidoreductase [Actinomycetota bacterium]
MVGAGYWGPNLVRNFRACSRTELLWVCDLSAERAWAALAGQTGVRVTESFTDVLDDPRVEAVAIATPAATHGELGLACLEAGKHLLVEKPLASSVAEGEKLVSTAARRGLTVMCDHTYCYTPAVQRIRQYIRDGTLGDIQYFDSVRINLGLVQSHIDVFWDLAPHDLAILDFILPPGCVPEGVAAQAADPLGVGHACVGYLTLPLTGGAIAHIHVNWLSPTKIRTTIIGGSKRMLVWDDLHPSQRLSMYDKGVHMKPLKGRQRREALISYRIGDMVAPALPEAEALQRAVEEFALAIREQRPPLTDGEAGLRVLRSLETASRSLERDGALVATDDHR